MGSEPENDLDEELNLFDPLFVAHPQPLYERARSRCPVAREPFTGSAVLSKYDDVLAALRSPEVFSSAMDAIDLGNERPLIPLQIDPPRQTRFRKILDPHFSRKRMLALEPDVRALTNHLIDAFVDTGECEFNQAFAIPLPATVFLRLMGLPLEDLDTFLELKDGIIRPEVGAGETPLDVRRRTAKRIYEYFDQVISERMRTPGEDLVSRLLESEIDGNRLERSEILDVCFLFIIAGLDTVTASLGCCMVYLAQHPEQREALEKNPSLTDAAVEELLRFESPVLGVPRILTRDVTVRGVTLPAGDTVTLLLGAADTDPDQFPEADEVRFDRRSNRHLAFGGGGHLCLGSHLARMELRVALEEIHRRIPGYRLKPGEEPRYGIGIREVQYLPLVFEPGIS